MYTPPTRLKIKPEEKPKESSAPYLNRGGDIFLRNVCQSEHGIVIH
jgi:hypothetical protein